MLLAIDDERRGDFAAAARGLAETSAAPIGLESYRRDRLARDLAASGQVAAALAEYAALEESDDAYAGAARTALDHRGAARKGRRTREGRGRARARGLREPFVESRSRAAAPAPGAPDGGRRGRARGRAAAAARGAARGRRGGQLRRSPSGPARRGGAAVAGGSGAAREGARLRRRFSARRRGARGRRGRRRGRRRARRDPGGARARPRRVSGGRRERSRRSRGVPASGSPASFEARLLRVEIESGRGAPRAARERPEDREARLADTLLGLASPEAPPGVRSAARERLVRLAYEAERFRRRSRAGARARCGLAGHARRLRAALEARVGRLSLGALGARPRALRDARRALYGARPAAAADLLARALPRA